MRPAIPRVTELFLPNHRNFDGLARLLSRRVRVSSSVMKLFNIVYIITILNDIFFHHLFNMFAQKRWKNMEFFFSIGTSSLRFTVNACTYVILNWKSIFQCKILINFANISTVSARAFIIGIENSLISGWHVKIAKIAGCQIRSGGAGGAGFFQIVWWSDVDSNENEKKKSKNCPITCMTGLIIRFFDSIREKNLNLHQERTEWDRRQWNRIWLDSFPIFEPLNR